MSNISFNPLAWAIKPLYDKAIAEDALFAKEVKEKESRTENPKSLDECAEYIMGEAFEWASNHRNGNMGFSGLPDDEMVNLIKHYYDEEDIVIKKVTGAKASVAKTGADSKAKAKAKEEKKSNVIPMGDLFASQSESKSASAKPVVAPPKKKETETYDLFAGLWGNEEEKKEEKKEEVRKEEKVEDVDVEEIEDDDDDLPAD